VCAALASPDTAVVLVLSPSRFWTAIRGESVIRTWLLSIDITVYLNDSSSAVNNVSACGGKRGILDELRDVESYSLFIPQ